MERPKLLEASMLLESGRLSEASQLLLAHVASNAGSTEAQLLLAELAMKQGRLDDAEHLLMQTKLSHSTQPSCRQQQVLQEQLSALKPLHDATQAAVTAAAWQEAKQQARACLAALQPTTAPGLAVKVLVMQATASTNLQEHDEAIQALDLALQLQPDCKDALWQRAAAHAAAGSHQAAFLDLRRLSTLQPTYPGIMPALQVAARTTSLQRRAAVQAAAPEQRYARVTRGHPHIGSAGGSSGTRTAGPSSSRYELYQVLGLSPAANDEAIRRAYKQLAAKLHPDKWDLASEAERAAAEEQFKAVSAAYQMLTSSSSRV